MCHEIPSFPYCGSGGACHAGSLAGGAGGRARHGKCRLGQAVVEPAGRESPVTSDPSETETGSILRWTYNFQEAGKEMEYALYVSKNYDGTKDSPLIVALHGLYSSPRQILAYPGFTRRAEKYGCLLVAPMGYNTRGWYGSRGPAGGCRGDPENLGELSEKDVLNVLELVRREFKIDDRRIYFF